MKRTWLVCLVFALLASALIVPADAAKTNWNEATRRVVATYDNPTLGSASGTGGAACLPCPSFAITETDRWVKMKVDDDVSPAPVAFAIRQETVDGRCCDYIAGPFCGSTGKRPVEITPGLDVYVFVFAFGDFTCPGAIGTTGTVTAVLSDTP